MSNLTRTDAVQLVPVRKILSFPLGGHGRRYKSLAKETETVHLVPKVKSLDVIVTKNKDFKGQYHKHNGTGQPLSIEISKWENSTSELTFVHELGHYLEQALIPGFNFGQRAWLNDPITQAWREAIRSTARFAEYREAEASGLAKRVNPDGTIEFCENPPHSLTYIMSEVELWARGYAQWVATRSGNPILLEQIRGYCSPQWFYRLQWDAEDFDPVAREFDALFGAIGWLT